MSYNKRLGYCLVAGAAMMTLASCADGASGPLAVGLPTGTISGVDVKSGFAFLGIPYAAPPVGQLRWQPPAPVEPWSGVRQAAEYSAACAQPDQGWNSDTAANSSEDCLYLNVYTPELGHEGDFPVMVWIHGGGYSGGTAMTPLFEGQNFSARKVVLVAINYRLGPFGFLAHPALSEEAATHTSGNYGLEDQIAAIEWVKENIAKFGGNPNHITIFGQSAGGGSVLSLLASPITDNLFQQAIVESGAAIGQGDIPDMAQAEQQGETFAQGRSLKALRDMTTEQVLERFNTLSTAGPAFRLGPIADKQVLDRSPVAAFAGHSEHKVPLIIGNNSREGLGRMSSADLPDAIRRTYGDAADQAMDLYGLNEKTAPDPILGDASAQFLTDTSFRCGSVAMAKWHSAVTPSLWTYQFEQSLPGREVMGAAHSVELSYVFGNLTADGLTGADYTPADRQLSNLMIDYWTNFAKSGNPNGDGLPEWPRFNATDRQFARFSTRFSGNVMMDAKLRAKLCDLYERHLDTNSP